MYGITYFIDASLISAQNAEKISAALVSRLQSKNVETKHKSCVVLVGLKIFSCLTLIFI
jgi:hypothetical protein